MNPDSPYLPPTSVVPAEDAPASSAPRKLALWSVLLCIIPFTASAIQMQFFNSQSPHPGTRLIIGAVFLLVATAAFVTGILALLLRRGRKGVVVPAVCGVAISGLLLSITVGGFMRGRESARARVAEASRAAETRRHEQTLNQALAGTKTGRDEPQSHSARLEQAAAQLTGKDAIAMRAAAEFTARVEEAGRARLAALERLKLLGPFDPASLRTHVALTQRREALKRLIAADEASAGLYAKSDSFFQETLARGQFTDTEIREFLDHWNRGLSTSPQHATLTAMLASDLRGARASLAAVNLLEKHFDGWKPGADVTTPVFKNSAAAAEYRRLSQEMRAASAEYNRAGTALQALIHSAPQAQAQAVSRR